MVVTVGLAVTVAEEVLLKEAPGLQVKVVPPPAALSVTELPEHKVSLLEIMTGRVGTETVTTAVAVSAQLPAEPVTVYIVVAVGVATTTAPLAVFSPVTGDQL